MQIKHVVALVMMGCLAPVTAALADDGDQDVKSMEAAPTAPIQSWTAVQQWVGAGWKGSDDRNQYGYDTLAGATTLADELGPRLSQLGRMSYIMKCFAHSEPNSKAALDWAICGSDVAQIDLKKLQAELVAAKVSESSRTEVMDAAKENLEAAKKIGAAVTEAAKTDPGVASILKLHDAAVAEWTAFAAKNQPMIDRYLALKDGVRSGKSNNKAFEGCLATTKPPLEKIVKAAKFPAEIDGDPMPFYVSYLVSTTEGYFATVAWGACAYSQHAAGESMFVAAANQMGGHARSGPRSITLAMAYADGFAPKFAERSLNWRDMKFEWQYGMEMPGTQDRFKMMTPQRGTVASLKPNGDSVTIKFAPNTVDACLQWKDTKRPTSFDGNGNLYYGKECAKRGSIPNQETPVDVPAKYVGGIAKGSYVIIVNGFPVSARKGKALTNLLGVAPK